MSKQIHRGIITIIGFWVASDGLVSLLYVALVSLYPISSIWQFLRIIRVISGIVLLIEAMRFMVLTPHTDRSRLKGSVRVAQFYRDFLVVFGVWMTVDGVGSMLYIYPIPVWQLIRFARLVIGTLIIIEAQLHLFSLRLEGEKSV